MKYPIEELIDIPQLQRLMEDLYQATGINHALIDVESKVLTAVGWQKICTGFHRVHPATCARCLESDQYILSHLNDGPYVGYRCPQGLTDYCTPVVIEGEHLANLFTGQMFHEPPDVDFFRKQAAEFGFDEESYLAALNEVHIIPKERMPGVMTFLQDLAQMLAVAGMARLRVLESEKRLKTMNEMLEARVAERTRELQDSEANLRRAQRVAGIGSWTLDIPDDRLDLSDETYRLLGITPNVPLTVGDFFARFHPDDRAAVDAAWQTALGGAPYVVEHRIVVDGRIKWVHNQAELEFDSDGKAHFAVGTVQDITHRKLAELQTSNSLSLLQATFNAIAEGVMVVDGAGHITAFNQRFAELWRIPAGILAAGDDDAALLFVLDQLAEPEQFLARVRQLYATPQADDLDTINFKDGRIFERNSTPQCIDGVAVGRVWSFRDVTERKRAENALKQLNETLEQRVAEETAWNMAQERLLIQQSRLAAMGEMIGNIAHQWRQPINALALMLANIKDAYEYNELDQAYLDETVQSGQNLIQKMSTTIDDFRNFFKPNSEKKRFRICDAATDAVGMVADSFKNQGIEIINESCCAPCFVYGYPNEYAQVVLNALTNAKDALTAKGRSGKVWIKIEMRDGFATALVSDDGGGIAPAILHKVFDPYFTTKEKGTGIGLYMSRMIMEKMGGDISIRNVKDGAEVSITLPLAKEPAV